MNSLHRLRDAFEDAEPVLRRNRSALAEQLLQEPGHVVLTDAIAAIDAALAQLSDRKAQGVKDGAFDDNRIWK